MSAATTFSDPQSLSVEALRALARDLIERVTQDSKRAQTDAEHIARNQAELQLRQLKIDALTQEIALLKHLRFAAKTENMDAVQGRLFAEANSEDLAAAEQRLARLSQSSKPASPERVRPASGTVGSHTASMLVTAGTGRRRCHRQVPSARRWWR